MVNVRRGVLLLLVLLPCQGFASAEVAVATDHVCALIEPVTKLETDAESAVKAVGAIKTKEAACWNANGEPLPIPPEMKLENPIAIVTGSHLGARFKDYTCVIDAMRDGFNRVKCWGKAGDEQSEILAAQIADKFKDLSHVQLLAAGSSDICAYDPENANKHLVCEGGPGQVRWSRIFEESKKLKNERFIALGVGTYYACGVTPELVTLCFGGVNEKDKFDQLLLPPAKGKIAEIDAAIRSTPRMQRENRSDPVSVTVGLAHACQQVGKLGQCWGLDFGNEIKGSFRQLSDVVSLDASSYRTCSVQTGPFQCWGMIDPWMENILKNSLNFAIEVVSNKEEFASDRETCLVTDRGLSCYGRFNVKIPVNLTNFGIARLEQEFSRMSFFAYKEKALIMEKTAALLGTLNPDDTDATYGRAFVLLALKQLVLQISSPFFKASINPRYQYMADFYGRQFNILTLASLRSSITGKLALELLSILSETVETHVMLDSERAEMNKFTVLLSEARGKSHPRPEEVRAVGEEGDQIFKEHL